MPAQTCSETPSARVAESVSRRVGWAHEPVATEPAMVVCARLAAVGSASSVSSSRNRVSCEYVVPPATVTVRDSVSSERI